MKKRIKPTQVELLPFRLGASEYAIDVLHVREIRPSAQIAPMAIANPRIRGAIDVRGVQVPVVDLRRAERPAAGDALVVVIAVAQRLVGIVVDAVCSIVEVLPPALPPAAAHLVVVADVASFIAARMAEPLPLSNGGEQACR